MVCIELRHYEEAAASHRGRGLAIKPDSPRRSQRGRLNLRSVSGWSRRSRTSMRRLRFRHGSSGLAGKGASQLLMGNTAAGDRGLETLLEKIRGPRSRLRSWPRATRVGRYRQGARTSRCGRWQSRLIMRACDRGEDLLSGLSPRRRFRGPAGRAKTMVGRGRRQIAAKDAVAPAARSRQADHHRLCRLPSSGTTRRRSLCCRCCATMITPSSRSSAIRARR